MRVTIVIDYDSDDPNLAAEQIKQWVLAAVFLHPTTPTITGGRPVKPLSVTAHADPSPLAEGLGSSRGRRWTHDISPEELEDAR